MPSFDIVSKIDQQEITNAVDQANREVANRFDLKGTNSRLEHEQHLITVFAPSDFQVDQVVEILRTKMAGRKIDLKALEFGDRESNVAEARQPITVRQGLDQELAKRLTKLIKSSKTKTQAAIQSDQIRVTGKKRDDLQQVIALLKTQDVDMPLQYVNFRD